MKKTISALFIALFLMALPVLSPCGDKAGAETTTIQFPVLCDFAPCINNAGYSTIIPNWDGTGNNNAVLVVMPPREQVENTQTVFAVVLDKDFSPVQDAITGSECYYAVVKNNQWFVYSSTDCVSWTYLYPIAPYNP